MTAKKGRQNSGDKNSRIVRIDGAELFKKDSDEANQFFKGVKKHLNKKVVEK